MGEWPFGRYLADCINAMGLPNREIERLTGEQIREARLRQLLKGPENGRPSWATLEAFGNILEGFNVEEAARLAEVSKPTGPALDRRPLDAKWTVDEMFVALRHRFSDASTPPPARALRELNRNEVIAKSKTAIALDDLATEREAEGDQDGAEQIRELATALRQQIDELARLRAEARKAPSSDQRHHE